MTSDTHVPPDSSSRAWYGATIDEFRSSEPKAILGALAANGDFALLTTQRDTWMAQIDYLQRDLAGFEGSIFFEFNIPRMGRRIDVVLIIGSMVFALEFKVGEGTFDRAGLDQVWDYALDLKNFHEASHGVSILPILIATEATQSFAIHLQADADQVYQPVAIAPKDLRTLIESALKAPAPRDFRSTKMGMRSIPPDADDY